MREETRRYAPETLRAFGERLCARAGLAGPTAAALIDSLLFAERRGVASHGLVRLPQYLRRVEAGVLDPEAPMRFTMEQLAVARLDAGNGFGQLAGRLANEKAMELAGKYGVGLVGVANSNHFGTGAWYAVPAAERGYFALNLSSASPAMAPFGAREPLLGTDPIGLAAPRREGRPPLVADLALSAAARGKLRLAALRGESIPSDWGLDAEGRETTDPGAVLAGGSLRPAGGAKGSALALFSELLCGVLTGSGLVGDTGNLLDTTRRAGTGHVFVCVDIARFLPVEEFAVRLEESLARLKALPPAGDGEVLLPGEPEERRWAECAARGVPVGETVRRELNALAERLGCPELD